MRPSAPARAVRHLTVRQGKLPRYWLGVVARDNTKRRSHTFPPCRGYGPGSPVASLVGPARLLGLCPGGLLFRTPGLDRRWEFQRPARLALSPAFWRAGRVAIEYQHAVTRAADAQNL
jgi:hypothetical protein